MTDAFPVSLDDFAVGQEVAAAEYRIDRGTLVRYAGASGDFNPIHYNDTVAREAGLPGVIAHGMLAMGTAVNVVADWIGDPTAISSYSTRFTNPIEVPATDAVTLGVRATIARIDQDAGTVQLGIDAEVDGEKVLGRARATVAVARAEA